MPKRLLEQATLFVSLTKWTIYASIVGVLVGVSTTVFLKALAWTTSLFSVHPHYFLLLPFTLFLSSTLVHGFAPDAAGHGTERVIAAVHERMGKIPLAVVPVKLLATVLTLASGGSAGKEGPCAQIGAGLASGFGSLLRINDIDRRKLVICGISAGFATVFGTPIAGALFGVEVLFLGQLLYDVLFPAFVAGIIGYHVSHALGVQYFHHTIRFVPQFSEWIFLKTILCGVFCGIAALALIEAMHLSEYAFARLRGWKPLRALVGGALLALIGGLVSPRYLGLGLETMESGLNGRSLSADACLWKIVATAITLGCGGSGGVVTPIFFIGTTVGNLFARLFGGAYYATYSAIGMVALLAGAANTPISASVMAIELFGPQIASYAALACAVSFIMVGHRSVYPSQVLVVQKSPSLDVPTGKPVEDIETVKIAPRPKTLLNTVLSFFARVTTRREDEKTEG